MGVGAAAAAAAFGDVFGGAAADAGAAAAVDAGVTGSITAASAADIAAGAAAGVAAPAAVDATAAGLDAAGAAAATGGLLGSAADLGTVGDVSAAAGLGASQIGDAATGALGSSVGPLGASNGALGAPSIGPSSAVSVAPAASAPAVAGGAASPAAAAAPPGVAATTPGGGDFGGFGDLGAPSADTGVAPGSSFGSFNASPPAGLTGADAATPSNPYGGLTTPQGDVLGTATASDTDALASGLFGDVGDPPITGVTNPPLGLENPLAKPGLDTVEGVPSVYGNAIAANNDSMVVAPPSVTDDINTLPSVMTTLKDADTVIGTPISYNGVTSYGDLGDFGGLGDAQDPTSPAALGTGFLTSAQTANNPGLALGLAQQAGGQIGTQAGEALGLAPNGYTIGPPTPGNVAPGSSFAAFSNSPPAELTGTDAAAPAAPADNFATFGPVSQRAFDPVEPGGSVAAPSATAAPTTLGGATGSWNGPSSDVGVAPGSVSPNSTNVGVAPGSDVYASASGGLSDSAASGATSYGGLEGLGNATDAGYESAAAGAGNLGVAPGSDVSSYASGLGEPSPASYGLAQTSSPVAAPSPSSVAPPPGAASTLGAPVTGSLASTPAAAALSSGSLAPASTGFLGSGLSNTSALGLGLAGAGLGASLLRDTQNPAEFNTLQTSAAALQSQGAQLQNYLTSGTLPPGIQAGLNQAYQSAASTIRSQYAARGQSGSTAEAQDLANLSQTVVSQGATIATQLLSQGISESEYADQIYTALMQTSIEQDQALSGSIANFAGALGGAAIRNPNITL